MPRPLIGVTTYPPSEAGRYALPAVYVDAVRRAGGEAVMIPPGTEDHDVDVEALVARLDGLVLAGGGDVGPDRYGSDGHAAVYGVHPARDRDELALVRHVLVTQLPTLAICRGSQVLNVALGGTLVPHLPDRTEQAHRLAPTDDGGPAAPTPHAVDVAPDSRLAGIMGTTSVTPMSWHHQAVDRPGTGLRVVARAEDGTVEATEHDDHRWLVSVQWHPELTAAEDPTQQRLFDALVQAGDAARGGSA